MEKLERRFKVMGVTPEDMLLMFQGQQPDEDGLLKISWTNMDPDIQVLAVNHNYSISRDCFELKLYHPDWPIAPGHLELEEHIVTLTQVPLQLTEEQLAKVKGWPGYKKTPTDVTVEKEGGDNATTLSEFADRSEDEERKNKLSNIERSTLNVE